MSLVQRSMAALKAADVGSSPAGHIQLLMLFKKGINMALDKNRIKSIANKHGIKVSFGSNKPGFLSESNKRLYTFSDLDKIIDKTLL